MVVADPFGAFVSRVAEPQGGEGPLSNLRLAVKDNIAVKGQPFTAGIPLYAERIATETAPAVQRLIDAGARFVGMTRTDSGGFGVTTPVVGNPTFPGCSVGGSSGGGAAALAAGFADIALGTDTGGSVRIPAACCSVFGFKPTLGLVAREGVCLMTPSFDTVGLMARDLPALLRGSEVLLGDRVEPATAQPALGFDPRRIETCEPVVAAAIHDALSIFKRAGVTIRPVDLPDRERMVAAHGTVVLAEARELYAEIWRQSPERLPETTRRALSAAQNVTDAEIKQARTDIDTMQRQFRDACCGLDAIVTPTLPVPPPPHGAHRVEWLGRQIPVIAALIAETSLANITGAPALSMPCPEQRASLQIMAAGHRDAALLAIAQRLQAALDDEARRRI